MGEPPQDDSDDIKTLALALDDIRRENQRLRDARASITHQLGPLPISAAAVAGLVSAFPGESPGSALQVTLIVVALLLFVVMVYVSVRYSGLLPYRKLRDRVEATLKGGEVPESPEGIAEATAEHAIDGKPPIEPVPSARARWYAAMINVERKVRGPSMAEASAGAGRQTDKDEPQDTRRQARAWALAKARVIARVMPCVKELLWPPVAKSLQVAFDLERRGLYLAQGLFAAIVVLLIVSRLV